MVDAPFTLSGAAKFTLFGDNGPMRTGRLSIARGETREARPVPRLAIVAAAEPRPVAPPTVPQAPEPHSFEYVAVHDRLTALERLAGLHERGALTSEEFAAEKALVLGLPADELLLPEMLALPPPPRAERGPSLVGRMLSWRMIPVGIAAGLGLSYATQPDETLRLFDQALRLIGA